MMRWQGTITAIGIGAVRRADGTHRRRCSNRARKIGIGRGAARADRAKRFPHPLLKRRSVEFDREPIERLQVAGEVGLERADTTGWIGMRRDDFGGIPGGQPFADGRRLGAEVQQAYTRVAGGEGQRPYRRRDVGNPNHVSIVHRGGDGRPGTRPWTGSRGRTKDILRRRQRIPATATYRTDSKRRAALRRLEKTLRTNVQKLQAPTWRQAWARRSWTAKSAGILCRRKATAWLPGDAPLKMVEIVK